MVVKREEDEELDEMEAEGPEQEVESEDEDEDEEESPAKKVDYAALHATMGTYLQNRFARYEKDRYVAEQKWLKNLRQFLGQYDPEILAMLQSDMSKAYPKLTRVKCVGMLSRLMNMLFPASEKNWSVGPSPVPIIDPEDIRDLFTKMQARLQQEAQAQQPPEQQQQGVPPPMPEITPEMFDAEVMDFVKERAKRLSAHIEDQLAELGGNALTDYVALCRKVIMSAIMYGIGVLLGPYTRETYRREWDMSIPGMPRIVKKEVYRPQFEFVPVWDWYPDMSAKTFAGMDGQFIRRVTSHAQARDLADREDFFGDEIRSYLADNPNGNYKERSFDSELRTMGVAVNASPASLSGKYEFLVWEGQVRTADIIKAGVEIPEENRADYVDACVWLLDGRVVKADLNPWPGLLAEKGVDIKVNRVHVFSFEEDDTSLIGNGLPNIMRDSALGIASSTRMMLDNAGIATGQNLEVNTQLLRADQDLTKITARKIWYRDDDSPATVNARAVNPIQIDSHIAELKQMRDMFLEFADLETFLSPATGGDLQKGPSEPFRTVGGASMLRGDMALPFKDVVRNFDSFTMSVLNAMVGFNLVFNDDPNIKGDYCVIARGANSLIAKEVRGIQLDTLKATMDEEDKLYIDEKQLLIERMAARDLDVRSIMVDDAEVERRRQARSSAQAQQAEALQELMRAEVRKTLADAVKSITQAQKNTATAEASQINAFLAALEKGLELNGIGQQAAGVGGMADTGGEQKRSGGPSALQVINNPRGAM